MRENVKTDFELMLMMLALRLAESRAMIVSNRCKLQSPLQFVKKESWNNNSS